MDRLQITWITTITVITTTTLILMTSPCWSDPIDEEMKCLKKKPNKQCSVMLEYPDVLRNLECDAAVPSELGDLLKDPPKIVVQNPDLKLPAGILVYMFDPDLPTPDVAQGFVHWIAKAALNKDGTVTDIKSVDQASNYYAPSPPSGQNHRYQVFIFPFDPEDDLVDNPGSNPRTDKLCDFKARNKLPDPVASTQFQYQSP